MQLPILPNLSVHAYNGGLFRSRGKGIHPTRIIDSFELIFVDRGLLSIAEAGTSFAVRAGEALLLMPGCPHGGTAPYPGDLAFFWVHFAGEAAASASGWDLPQHPVVARPERLREWFRAFLAEQESPERGQATLDLLLLLMLHELARPAPPPPEASAAVAALAARAATWIREHLHHAIGAADVARAMNCHPDYLGRCCRRVWGHSLTEAIHRQRVRLAQRELTDSARPIRQIADDTGFADPAYFRRIFRRYTGESPGQYRRRLSHMHVNTW